MTIDIDTCGMDIITDTDNLYEAFKASMRGSRWKREVQEFQHNWMEEIYDLKQELLDHTYKTLEGVDFKLNERGKTRHIHAAKMRDRVVRHVLCDKILNPCLKPYLIYNNGASQKGKGLSFSRNEFEKDLHRYYVANNTNEGYIGFVDLSKFYDNIQHDVIRELVYPKIPRDIWWLMDEVLSSFEVDVSYMTDEEYELCMAVKFNSIYYYETIPKHMRTGEKFMKKSVDIGDQVSQDLGVFVPTRVDNYAKIVRGLKYYGRYMDDIYFITKTKEDAEDIMVGICKQAKNLGLFVNHKKTRIVKLSSSFKYLQIKYFLTDTGKVVKRINPVNVTRERRKLKKYKHLLDEGIMSYEDIEQAYKSWMGNYVSLMSKKQVENMKRLYKDLFGKDVRWKKQKSLLKAA